MRHPYWNPPTGADYGVWGLVRKKGTARALKPLKKALKSERAQLEAPAIRPTSGRRRLCCRGKSGLEGGMADELDDVAEPDELEELDDASLDDEQVDDLEEGDVDELEEDDDSDVEVAVDGETAAETEPAEPAAARTRAEDAEEEEEEEPEDEDVEASLDVILKERLVVEDEVDDEELPEPEDRGEGAERIRPKQPGEFVCRSCFLVKHPSQMADNKRMLCRDCV